MAVALAAGIGALVAGYWLVPATFEAQVNADAIQVAHTSFVSRVPPWRFREAHAYIGSDAAGRAFAGTVILEPGVQVAFSRRGSGPLRIRVAGPTPSTKVATLHPDDGPGVDVQGRLVLRVEDPGALGKGGENPVLPIVGEIITGADVAAAAPGSGLLRGGKVKLVGHSLFSYARFEAESLDLMAGDGFAVEGARGDASGIVIADERPGLSCVYRVVASRGVVSRFGAQGYVTSVSLVSRVKSDAVLQGIWAAFGLLYAARKLTGRKEGKA